MNAFNWFGKGWIIPGANTAFLTSLIAATLLTLAVIPYGKRRPRGTPFSWGEAMLGATYSFAVMFLAFGVVPHQWLTHVQNELGWQSDKPFLGPGSIFKSKAKGGNFAFDINYLQIGDILVTGIYGLFLGLFIWIFVWWQKRGEVQARPAELPSSTFGRPLVRKG
jgi:hypothetical protein